MGRGAGALLSAKMRYGEGVFLRQTAADPCC